MEAFENACEKGALKAAVALLSMCKITRAEAVIYGFCRALVCACRGGDVDTVKFVCTEFALTPNEVRAWENYAIQEASNFGVIKYLHEKFKLTTEEMRRVRNRGGNFIRIASGFGCVEMAKYLHKEVGLTTEDARADGNLALHEAVRRGNLEMIKCLHDDFGLTDNDARDAGAIEIASRLGHLEILKYLHDVFGLTDKDAYGQDNWALYLASKRGHLGIVEYLHSGFGLWAIDARSKSNRALCAAASNGHIAVVKYLCTNYGLTKKDARMALEDAKAHSNVFYYLVGFIR